MKKCLLTVLIVFGWQLLHAEDIRIGEQILTEMNLRQAMKAQISADLITLGYGGGTMYFNATWWYFLPDQRFCNLLPTSDASQFVVSGCARVKGKSPSWRTVGYPIDLNGVKIDAKIQPDDSISFDEENLKAELTSTLGETVDSVEMRISTRPIVVFSGNTRDGQHLNRIACQLHIADYNVSFYPCRSETGAFDDLSGLTLRAACVGLKSGIGVPETSDRCP